MGKQFRWFVSGVVVAVVAAGAVITGPVLDAGAADAPVAVTPFSGFDPGLTRAPYVTDLTQASADVVWGTLPSSDHGTLKWGTGSSCTSHSVSPGVTQEFTVQALSEDQSTATITGLAPSTTYCYRVYSLSTGTDLLGSGNPSQSFTTLASAGSSTPVSFDVVGDLGETYYTDSGGQFPNAPTNFNPDEAAIDHLIGQSNAQFVVTAGDVAYNDGSQTNYGDLQTQGSRVSDIFGPSYWPETGGLPAFGNVGNHGQNSNSLEIWPESATATASGGTYAYQSFPQVDGITAGSAPNAWYAISAGNTRIYVLDAAWADGNIGTASSMYQVDHDEHWTPSSPEYQWLQSDLANPAYAGMTKMAVFHFPLRSANSTESSDTYLQNSAANPDGASSSLEALLASNGVRLVFNGHAHTYQRIVPSQSGQITNYVTGGGGGVLEPVSNCSGVGGSVYALGWSPTSNSGYSCGTSAPGSAADVYNFLKVTVTGSSITVDPENAAGKVFDPQTYGPPTTSGPSTPGSVTALASSSTSIQVDWAPSTEKAPGTIVSYLVYRNASQTPVAWVSGNNASFLDTTVVPGTKYTYQIVAVDNSNLQSSRGGSNSVATPSAPGNVAATATSGTSVQLNWTASSETGGSIQSYEISRNGTVINPDNPVPASSTSYTDTTAQPGTTYTYAVTALDKVGGQSTPASSNPVTTPGQAPGGLPFTSGCMSQLPAGSVVGSAALPDGTGYYEVDSAGDVAAFGGATCHGAMTGTPLNRPIVGMAVDPATGGYWLVATDGGIFSFNAPFYGSTGAIRLNKPIVGMASTPSGGGYWMVASDGGVFTFGNNQVYGSTGNLVLNKPVVGMAADPATGGYWLVATDGGIFSFNAPFYGSTGAIRLNKPIVGMASTPSGGGYWMVASDGGVFTFGNNQ
ncbi:MAG: fibronectin type III domain-containing protein, partial [Acidimicrobiales bacterium]